MEHITLPHIGRPLTLSLHRFPRRQLASCLRALLLCHHGTWERASKKQISFQAKRRPTHQISVSSCLTPSLTTFNSSTLLTPLSASHQTRPPKSALSSRCASEGGSEGLLSHFPFLCHQVSYAIQSPIAPPPPTPKPNTTSFSSVASFYCLTNPSDVFLFKIESMS